MNRNRRIWTRQQQIPVIPVVTCSSNFNGNSNLNLHTCTYQRNCCLLNDVTGRSTYLVQQYCQVNVQQYCQVNVLLVLVVRKKRENI